ncbi:uncharacterized protein BYT42DRAFT_566671 [Radiomyces spectabilis]|uniref:uncharacterized protein n=1 Tax=Radiomyces spectabilis TaxID=64574 RepID=UPI0022205B3D|nr:uncharacterized protein BYT42DRAFT_566671 [Radiomyces spectabilis]KAI8381477.1 hypothetical protein BYT42DRAFT_566671 [Radiomyces spectabilis]
MSPVVYVIGANVQSLTTALLLRRKGYDVTVLSTHFPGDANSNDPSSWSSAQWTSFASDTDTRLKRYDAATFHMFWELAKCKAAEAGLMVVSSYNYSEKPIPSGQAGLWWKTMVPSFQILRQQELPSHFITGGYHYTTVVINVGRYLRWLQSQYLSLGGKRRRVPSRVSIDDMLQDDAFSDADVVLNCSNMNDPDMLYRYKQTIVVRASHIRRAISVTKNDDTYTFITPRNDGTIIIGRIENVPQRTLDNNKLLKEGLQYCPDLLSGQSLNQLDPVSEYSGRIPFMRRNGPRLQNEFKISAAGKTVLVTHHYGYNAIGYQSSWGSSQEAVQLVNEGWAFLQKESENICQLISRL